MTREREEMDLRLPTVLLQEVRLHQFERMLGLRDESLQEADHLFVLQIANRSAHLPSLLLKQLHDERRDVTRSTSHEDDC